MTRKRYSSIKKSLMIHILNTTSTMSAKEIKAINKAIYKADFRIPASLKGHSYKGLYEELDKSYHLRVIAGKA